MASFDGKIGWKGERNGENKNYRYINYTYQTIEPVWSKSGCAGGDLKVSTTMYTSNCNNL